MKSVFPSSTLKSLMFLPSLSWLVLSPHLARAEEEASSASAARAPAALPSDASEPASPGVEDPVAAPPAEPEGAIAPAAPAETSADPELTNERAVAASAIAAPHAVPPAPHSPEPPPPDPETLPYTYHQKHLDFQATLGPGWLTDSGVDPYSSSDGVALLGARIGGAPIAAGRFAFAVLGEGTYGSVSGSVRGNRSSLELGTLAIGLEARYHFHHTSYGFARVSPGVAYAQTSVTDAAVSLSDDGFQPSVAGHLGVALRVAGPADGRVRAPRVWLMLEAGYRYTGQYGAVLRAPEESPVEIADLEMPSFSLVGPDASVGVAISF